MSLFITFEGVEGSGKTTQIRRLSRYLARKGIPCLITREPGGCPIAEEIRKILLNPDHRKMVPLTELLLYEAARTQHVKEVIAPFLKKEGVVISDRFADASIAYQGYGRGVDLKLIESLNRLASEPVKEQRIEPEVTFLLDCSPQIGLKRAIHRNQTKGQEREGRFELEKAQFHNHVRKGYLSLAKKSLSRFKVIDTREGKEKVFEKIRNVIDELMKNHVLQRCDRPR